MLKWKAQQVTDLIQAEEVYLSLRNAYGLKIIKNLMRKMNKTKYLHLLLKKTLKNNFMPLERKIYVRDMENITAE